MNDPDWQKIKDLFTVALDLPANQRIPFLEIGCEGDSRLFAEVTSLLAASSEPQNLIENNVIDLASNLGVSGNGDYVEKHFGAYKIIREIGSGGMGTVFLASRDDGEYTKRVALKIVRQSIAESEIIARFKRERQILAGLTHPNISVLHDGGLSEKGEPFLAMEYIDGETLIDFALARKLTVPERLRLFLKICSAVAYAHRNLVIHRDLKPSNILVGPDGEPKLLDFGLAKSFDLEDEQTQTQLRAFTPAYASPEQITGKNITTASDIYSLGVILYELLSGAKPLQMEDKTFEDIIRTINSTDPVPPSEIPDKGPYEEPNRRLKGDLDKIVLMALRKEPDRRYRSVEEFAEDIRHHLNGRPITARPNTFGYRSGKFIRRNKIPVAAIFIVSVALLAGTVISLWQASIARLETARSQSMNNALRKLLNTAIPASGAPGKRGAQTSIADVLNETERSLNDGELASQPDVSAEIRQILGEGFFSLGIYDAAERNLNNAFNEHAVLYGANSIRTLKAEIGLGSIYLLRADYSRAVDIFERRFNDLKSEFFAGRIEPEFYFAKANDYAVTCRATGNAELAESVLRDLIRQANERSLPAHADQSKLLLTLLLLDQGRLDEAKISQTEMLTRLKQTVEIEDPAMPQALTLLGSILMENGELDAAESNLRDAEKIYRKLYGPENNATYDNIRLQAQVAYLKGEYVLANDRIDRVLENYRKVSSPKYISYSTALTIKGLTLNKLGKRDAAEELLREAVRLRDDNLPPGHFMTAITKGALGEVLTDKGNLSEAAPLLRESLDSLSRSQKVDSPRIRLARERLAKLDAKPMPARR